MREVYKIAYDPVEKRPGCILIQAAMGGIVPGFTSLFPTESWLLAPTPDMKLLPISAEKLAVLVKITEDNRNSRY
jgi:hypothetical protein